MSGFGRGIRSYTLKAREETQGLKVAAALAFFGGAINDTPVLSGHLKGNWQFTKGAPALSVIANTDTSVTGGPTFDAMRQGVLNAGPDDVLILRNNLPYAFRIEFEGWSRIKAPQGMVRRNFVRVVGNLKQLRRV